MEGREQSPGLSQLKLVPYPQVHSSSLYHAPRDIYVSFDALAF